MFGSEVGIEELRKSLIGIAREFWRILRVFLVISIRISDNLHVFLETPK
jgi:hypothetical protein